MNDNLNLAILERFLGILKKIEDGELDQHEGSYLVGTYLKEMYIDSVLKSEAKSDNSKSSKSKQPLSKAEKKISYKDFKELSK